MNEKICEVLCNSAGEPTGMAYGKKVPRWKRRRAWRKAWKTYNAQLAEMGMAAKEVPVLT